MGLYDVMDLTDRVRAYVYRHFAEAGVMPRMRAIATELSAAPDAVEDACIRLASDHLLVLAPDRRTIERAGPFSDAPTAFRVVAGDRSWWANCAWDALGIPPMLSIDARVETTCGDCGEPLTATVSSGELVEPRGFVHVPLPARRWWDDIRFT